MRVKKIQHGNLRVTFVDHDFVESGDYAQIRKTAKVLEGLLGALRVFSAANISSP